jgi:hypothetical protein
MGGEIQTRTSWFHPDLKEKYALLGLEVSHYINLHTIHSLV